MKLTHDMLTRLELLEEKYTAMGQNMQSYLDGLIHADYLTYWDYIHIDTLLSLQSPKTPFPDEYIFITYHQITELYFKLILQAMHQLVDNPSPAFFKRQLKRINTYFDILVDSFLVMIEGLDKDEFLQFRMSLLPSSGFQSGQYRMIEILSTNFINLVHHTKRADFDPKSDINTLYPLIYWKYGATELATGKKTLTLKQFERKYSKAFKELANDHLESNVWKSFKKLPKEAQEDEEIIALLKRHDLNANVRWPLSHYRAAVRHLNREPEQISATGGTNWQEYLPPKNQRIIFYPEIWSEEELDNWGKGKIF